MPNINEKITTVTRWDRAGKVMIDNKFGELPTLEFIIEKAKLEDNKFSVEGYEGWKVDQDFSAEFPMYNPLTEELIPGATGSLGMLHAMMYSLFFNEVAKRATPAPTVPLEPVVTEGDPSQNPDPPPLGP